MSNQAENPQCEPCEIAIKSLFLGPKAENADWFATQTESLLKSWFQWRCRIAGDEPPLISSENKKLEEYRRTQQLIETTLRQLLADFENEIPKFHPRYVGHMFSEVSLPALLGHLTAILHNPNNISKSTSKVGTRIESETLRILLEMMGLQQGRGHFTSGGTVANFEFLFRARERWALRCLLSLYKNDPDLLSPMRWTWEEHEACLSSQSDLMRADFLAHRSLGEINDLSEAKWARRWSEPVLLVSGSKHYSWPKAMHYLGFSPKNLVQVELDRNGRMSPQSLSRELDRQLLQGRSILGVVAIMGTTEMGTLDPLAEIHHELQQRKQKEGLQIWLHADAAYGGFLRCLVNQTEVSHALTELSVESLKALSFCQSLTLDPHKLGYVPYSSGVFLCSDPRDYAMRQFMGPYIKDGPQDLGGYTLEGSRSAAGAVSTFFSLKSLLPERNYERLLSRTLKTKKDLEKMMTERLSGVFIPQGLDTNILCFQFFSRCRSLSQANQFTQKIEAELNRRGAYQVSRTTLMRASYAAVFDDLLEKTQLLQDTDQLVLLRATLMNPFLSSKEGGTDHLSSFCQELETIRSEVEQNEGQNDKSTASR